MFLEFGHVPKADVEPDDELTDNLTRNVILSPNPAKLMDELIPQGDQSFKEISEEDKGHH